MRSLGLLLLGLACSIACSSATAPTAQSLTGQWGGSQIALTVAGTSSHVELDCAHGDFGAVTSSSFQISGTFVQEHGGPIEVGGTTDSHPAMFVGSVTADTMTLTIRLSDTGATVGTFTLAHSSSGTLVKCV